MSDKNQMKKFKDKWASFFAEHDLLNVCTEDFPLDGRAAAYARFKKAIGAMTTLLDGYYNLSQGDPDGKYLEKNFSEVCLLRKELEESEAHYRGCYFFSKILLERINKTDKNIRLTGLTRKDSAC